ncbi:hypothetical protein TorRG33x02_028450 [Trema orientale]|uniref:Uncharacterized protein n=1 Tax=Trema orientale TaxID=63057 RepID=A0A2P5FUR6_TREOI|nr:hypothetical protein TorRG33x02_028450 [Trema orientale]
MSDETIQVWIMGDCFGSVKGSSSWIKQLTIGPFIGMASPLTFWKSDELLMRVNREGKLVSYNIHTKKFRNLAINGAKKVRCWALPYMKSLFSVQRRRQAQS